MSDDVLELARRVWPAAQPSQEDVDAAVRRLRRRLRRRRSRPRRAVSVAVAIAVGCISAVAWAAASSWFAPSAPHPPLPPAAPALRAAAAAALTRIDSDSSEQREKAKAPAATAPAPAQPATRPQSPAAPPPAVQTAEPPVAQTAERPQAPQTAEPASAWKQVGDALAAGDERRAAQLLDGLSKHGDAETRGKAALGLAQLAASRGDCARARALAAAVIGGGASPALTRRAKTLMRECP